MDAHVVKMSPSIRLCVYSFFYRCVFSDLEVAIVEAIHEGFGLALFRGPEQPPGVQGLGFMVHGLGFGVYNLQFRVEG